MLLLTGFFNLLQRAVDLLVGDRVEILFLIHDLIHVFLDTLGLALARSA